jgi:hypothetical protein
VPRWKKSEAEGRGDTRATKKKNEKRLEGLGRTRSGDEAGVSRLRKREGGRERASLGTMS